MAGGDRTRCRPARGNGAVKQALREVLEMMAAVFAANLAETERSPRKRALALVALAVGGMVLARAVDDKVLSDEIRDSARTQAYETTGWEMD